MLHWLLSLLKWPAIAALAVSILHVQVCLGLIASTQHPYPGSHTLVSITDSMALLPLHRDRIKAYIMPAPCKDHVTHAHVYTTQIAAGIVQVVTCRCTGCTLSAVLCVVYMCACMCNKSLHGACICKPLCLCDREVVAGPCELPAPLPVVASSEEVYSLC